MRKRLTGAFIAMAMAAAVTLTLTEHSRVVRVARPHLHGSAGTGSRRAPGSAGAGSGAARCVRYWIACRPRI